MCYICLSFLINDNILNKMKKKSVRLNSLLLTVYFVYGIDYYCIIIDSY